MRVADKDAIFSEVAQKSLRRSFLVIPSLLAGKGESLLAIFLGLTVAQCFFGDLLWPTRSCLVALVASCEASTLCSRTLASWRSRQSGISLAAVLCLEILIGTLARRSMLFTDGVPDQVSFVVPARYEADYIVQTLAYIYESTPIQLIHQIIVIDDCSAIPVEPLIRGNLSRWGLLGFLSVEQRQTMIVHRNDEREGLIRAKIRGANMASGTHILFLDGHCRVMPGYLQRMLARIKGNYKRIVVPLIPDTDNKTWAIKPATGVKMMFAWDFSFDWFDYPGDEVPILSGGVLLMTRRWWVESGGYDHGMLEWGGENLDQSMRVWQCGGEIVVERGAFIGHIFYRPLPPDKSTGFRVVTNQARAAIFWLDDYYRFFLEAVPFVRNLDLGPGVAEQLGRRASMQCHGFDWFVNRFRSVFELRGLLLHDMHNLRHVGSSLCLDVIGGMSRLFGPPPKLQLRPCGHALSQRWGFASNGTRLVNAQVHRCLQWAGIDATNWRTRLPRLEDCDHTLQSLGQIWGFSGPMPGARGGPNGYVADSSNATIQFEGYVFTGGSEYNAHKDNFLRGHYSSSALCLTSSHDIEATLEQVPCANLPSSDCIYVSPCRNEARPRRLDTQAWEWIW